MKEILTDVANIGAVTARTIAFKIRSKEAYFYPNSSWRLPFFGGYKFEVSPGVSNLDGAAFFYYFATGVTPENTPLGVVEKVKQLREIGVSINEKITPVLNSEQQPKFQAMRERARRRIIEEIGSAVLQKLKDFRWDG